MSHSLSFMHKLPSGRIITAHACLAGPPGTPPYVHLNGEGDKGELREGWLWFHTVVMPTVRRAVHDRDDGKL